MVGVPPFAARQKLLTAVLILACEMKEIDQRLEAAYRSAISNIDPQLEVPPELKDEFVDLRSELQKEFLHPEGAGSPSGPARRLWAAEAARRLVTFYDRLIKSK